MNIFTSLFKKKATAPQQTIPQNQLYRVLLSNIGLGTPLYDIDGLEDTVDKGYLYNHVVYSIINKITNSISGVPWSYYVEKNKNAKARYSRAMQHKDIDTAIYTKQTQFEEVNAGETYKILTKPNSYQTFNDLVIDLANFFLITGNGYNYAIRRLASLKDVIELHTVPAHLVEIVFGTYFNPVKAYRLHGYIPDDIPPENILHIKNFNPNYSQYGTWLYGLSPIQAASNLLTLSNHAITSQITSFDNQGAMGVLTGKTGSIWNQPQVEQMKAKWDAKKGSINDIIISGEEVSWTQIGLSPVDMQIIESQKMSMRDLCNIYHVPSQLLNDSEHSTYNNMKEARKALITDASLPLMEKLKSGFNRFLLPENDKGFIDYDIQAFIELNEDLNQMAATLNQMWWLTGNEKRMKSNVPEIDIPVMNEILIPMGTIPASEFGQEPEIDPNSNDDMTL